MDRRYRIAKAIVGAMICALVYMFFYVMGSVYTTTGVVPFWAGLGIGYLVLLWMSGIYIYMVYDSANGWKIYPAYGLIIAHAVYLLWFMIHVAHPFVTLTDSMVCVGLWIAVLGTIRIPYYTIRIVTVVVCMAGATAQTIYMIHPAYQKPLPRQQWYTSQQLTTQFARHIYTGDARVSYTDLQQDQTFFYDTSRTEATVMRFMQGVVRYQHPITQGPAWLWTTPLGQQIYIYPQTQVFVTGSIEEIVRDIEYGSVVVSSLSDQNHVHDILVQVSGVQLSILQGTIQVDRLGVRLYTAMPWVDKEKIQTPGVWYLVDDVWIQQGMYDPESDPGSLYNEYILQHQATYVMKRKDFFTRYYGGLLIKNTIIDLLSRQLVALLHSVYPQWYFSAIQRYGEVRRYVPIDTQSIVPIIDTIQPQTGVRAVLQQGGQTIWHTTRIYKRFFR